MHARGRRCLTGFDCPSLCQYHHRGVARMYANFPFAQQCDQQSQSDLPYCSTIAMRYSLSLTITTPSSRSFAAAPVRQASCFPPTQPSARLQRGVVNRAMVVPVVSLFSFGTKASTSKRTENKEKLLEYIAPLQRGLKAGPEEKAEVDRLARELERANPNKASLSSPLINGQWELLYTTSDSILGRSKPPFLRPLGPIYQYIDAINLKARNQETAPLFNSVTAELTPISKSEAAVQFKTFKLLGLISITAPASAKGKLDTTYVDETLRISRGDKGNLFILEQRDPAGKP